MKIIIPRAFAAGLTACLTLVLFFCAKQKETAMEGMIDVNGASFYYRTVGKGEPVLVLHGGPGMEHDYLLPGLPRISAGHRFIFFDQRSCGRTQGAFDSSRMTIPGFVEDIEAIRKSMRLGRMNLMGHSWGGLLALFYAVEHPDHLKSLILISPAGASYEYQDAFVKNLAARRTAEDSAELERLSSIPGSDKTPSLVEQWYKVYFRAYFHDAALTDSLEVKVSEKSLEINAHSLLFRGLERYDIHDRLDAVDVPCLIVHGRQDPLPAQCSERIHEHLPESELVLIDRCGHFPYVERPDTLAAVFGGFMKNR
jgi:proline iminopeptidase